MNLTNLLFGKKRKPRKKNALYDVYQNLYPESVRYALQYKEAQLGKPEMTELLDRFLFEVVYLVIKVYADNPEQQRGFLQELTCLYVDPMWNKSQLRELLRKHIDTMPEGTSVTGTKLAQLNRYGSDHWQTTFKNLAERIFESDYDELPCIIAHTPLLAFHHFVKIYNTPKSLGKILILVPAWMEDESNEMMGYEITLTGDPIVNYQEKDECLFGQWECYKHECPLHHRYCRSVVFIDDTINTGSTAGKLQSFWHTEYGLNIPQERVRVITDLRGKGYIKAKPKS